MSNELTTLKQDRDLAIKILHLTEEILESLEQSFQPKTAATAGNIPIFDSTGALVDSTFKIEDLQGGGEGGADIDIVSDEVFDAYLNELFPLDNPPVTPETIQFDAVFNVAADSFLYI